MVDQANGIQKLLQVMKTYLGRSGEGTNKLRIVLCGFLLNLTNTHGKQTTFGTIEIDNKSRAQSSTATIEVAGCSVRD